MKKIFSYVVVAISLFSATSCETGKKVYNRSVETEKYGKMLLGRQTKSQLDQEPFGEWFNQEYNDYEYDKEIVKQLQKNKLNSHHITIFFGTWCGDTHRELPRMIKILEAAKFPDQKLELIAVNRKMESPDGIDVKHHIRRVPTIIVKKYGQEKGRIIEIPMSGSLEKDLLDIIKKK